MSSLLLTVSIAVATKQASLLPHSASHEGTLDKHARKLAPPAHNLSMQSHSQAGDVLAAAAHPPVWTSRRTGGRR